ncbi:Rib/alpha-like domain-containing protein, partial [Streptococcus mitis]|uniref:Rib/alpha-like domain-containing protein n=1 Tax=Streptococcus mitis TaxID=28037 RepID=UPI0021B78FEA
MKFGKHPGEKLTRFSIRKYHFGAASVAVASLLFFGANSVKAEEALVARQDGVASSSNPNSGEGDPDQATLAKPEGSVYQAPEAGTNATIGSTTTPVGGATKINDEGTSKPQLDKKSLPTEIAKSQVDKSELSSVVNQVSATISSLQSSSLAENVKTALAQVESAVANAKQVLANPDASKADVEQALSSLQQAVSSLEAAKRPEVAPKPAQPEQPAEGNSGEEASLPKKRGKKSLPVANPIADGKEETATLEVANPAPATLEPVTLAGESGGKRRRGRVVQPESAGGSNPEAEVAPKALPTYTNGTDNYALADEMRNIVKYLKDNGADAAKVAAFKANYDKLNEKLGLADENAVLSEEDFKKALADLKQARDYTEGFLNNQPSAQPEAVLPGNRLNRQAREAGKNFYNSLEYYYDNGTEPTPYKKYTYIFHSIRQDGAIDGRNEKVENAQKFAYMRTVPTADGFTWEFVANKGGYNNYYSNSFFFTVPNGQAVKANTARVTKLSTGEVFTAPSIELALQAAGLKRVTRGTMDNVIFRQGMGAGAEAYATGSLNDLAREETGVGSINRGFYKAVLESAESRKKANEKFDIIKNSGGSVYYFEIPERTGDSYRISFQTNGTNNPKKLAYAAGLKAVQNEGVKVRTQVDQFYAQTNSERDATDRFVMKLKGNGTFLIDQDHFYNKGWPSNAATLKRDANGNPQGTVLGNVSGTGGVNIDNIESHRGLVTYGGAGSLHAIDFTSYVMYEGYENNFEAGKQKANNEYGQNFYFFNEEGNELSKEALGRDAGETPGLHKYKYKRTFRDGSADDGYFNIATRPKNPTIVKPQKFFVGSAATVTVKDGNNGKSITLFREYVENGVAKTEEIGVTNANSSGVATFNLPSVKEGKYYARSIIKTDTYLDYAGSEKRTVESDLVTSDNQKIQAIVPPKVRVQGQEVSETREGASVLYEVIQGERFQPRVEAWDDKGNLTKFNIDNLRPGITSPNTGSNFRTINSATIKNTSEARFAGNVSLTETPGEYTSKITVADESGEEKDYFYKYRIIQRDTEAPTVSMNGKTLTENASANRFVIYRGATFNPTFVVNDNSGTVSSFKINNVPEGVWFNKNGGSDSPKENLQSGTSYQLAINNTVSNTANLGTHDANVVVRDAQGNEKTYKFQYTVVDVQPKNTPKTVEINSQLGDARDYLKAVDSNSGTDVSKYLPDNATYSWKEGQTTRGNDTKLDTVGSVTKYKATVTFPNNTASVVKRIDGHDYTIYRPASIERDVRFDVRDTVAPTVKLNGTELTNNVSNSPTIDIYRGANLELPLTFFDNAKTGNVNISYVNNAGLPRGVWFNESATANSNVIINQNGRTENAPGSYTVRGKVAPNATLGISEVTLKVSDDATGSVDKGNKKEVKFRVRVLDIDFERGRSETAGVSKVSDELELNQLSPDPNDYLTVNNGADRNDNMFPQGMAFRFITGANNKEFRRKLSFNTPGVHVVKAGAFYPTNNASTNGEPTPPTDATGDDVTEIRGRAYLTREVEFRVKPTAPTVTVTNGDVVVAHTNQTNVNTLSFTYTDKDNRQKTVTATKTNGTWALASDAPADGVAINPQSGAVTIKDREVKDGQAVTAKVAASGVNSNETTANATAGERVAPTFTFNSNTTRVENGERVVYVTPTETTSFTLGTVSDNSNKLIETRLSTQDNRQFNLDYGLNYNELTKQNNNEVVAPRDITVSGKLDPTNKSNHNNPWTDGDLVTRYVVATDAAGNEMRDLNSSISNSTRVKFKVLTQATKYTPTATAQTIAKDITANGATVTETEFNTLKQGITFALSETAKAKGKDQTELKVNRDTDNLTISMKDSGRIQRKSDGTYFVGATVTYPDRSTDTVEIPVAKSDTQPPEVWVEGRKLTENANDTHFIIYRGAAFNPTFRVNDNSGTTAYLKASGIPEGVWFNKQNGRDVEKTNLQNSTNPQYQITTNNVVENINRLGDYTANVTVKDALNNEKTYKFKYTIADVELKTTTKRVQAGTALGDPHNFVGGITSNGGTIDDTYLPSPDMRFEWYKGNASVNDNTTLTSGTHTEYKVRTTFPGGNGGKHSRTINGEDVIIYTPAYVEKTPTIIATEETPPTVKLKNLTDNNTVTALDDSENSSPIITVFRGAKLNVPLTVYDNDAAGRVNLRYVSGLPDGVSFNGTNNNDVNLTGKTVQNSENRVDHTISGVVAANAPLGLRTVTLKASDGVNGVESGNQTDVKFRVNVVDVAFKKDKTTDETANKIISPVPVGTSTQTAREYLRVNDGTSQGEPAFPEGTKFAFVDGNNPPNFSETLRFTTPGKFTRKVRAYFPRDYAGITDFGSTRNDLSGSSAEYNGLRYKEKEIEFQVQPSTPVITSKDNGDVVITSGNEPYVKFIDVTYTPQTGENPQPVTVRATKEWGVDNWSFPADSPLKIDKKNATITIKDRFVKDGSDVTVKVLTSDGIESNVPTGVAGQGDHEYPTVDFQNTETDGQGNRVVYITPTETTNVNVATLRDNSGKLLEAGFYNREGNSVDLGNGLTNTKLARNGETETSGEQTLRVSGTLNKFKEGTTPWVNGDIIGGEARYASATDPAENKLLEKQGVAVDNSSSEARVLFKVLTQAAKYTPTVSKVKIERDITAPNTNLSTEEFNRVKATLGFTTDRGSVNVTRTTNDLAFEMKDNGRVNTKADGSLYINATVTYPDKSTEIIEVPLDTTDANKSKPTATEASVRAEKDTTAQGRVDASQYERVLSKISVPENQPKPTSKAVKNNGAITNGKVTVELTYADNTRKDIEVPVLEVKPVEITSVFKEKDNTVTIKPNTAVENGDIIHVAVRGVGMQLTKTEHGYESDRTDRTFTVAQDGSITLTLTGEEKFQAGDRVVTRHESNKNGKVDSYENEAFAGLLPVEKVPTSNPAALNDKEKTAVKEAVKKANPSVNIAELVVAPNGDVTYRHAGAGVNDATQVQPITLSETVREKNNAETYEPIAKEQVVNIGDEPQASNGIENVTALPTNTTFTWKQSDKPDTRTSGVKQGTVVVHYPDTTEEEITVSVVVKEAKPTAPEISQWQNGNVKVTPAETNSGDKITVPVNGSEVVLRNYETGWQIEGTAPEGVTLRDNSLEIPRNLVSDTATAIATKGEDKVATDSDQASYTLLAHTVKLTDVVKKADSVLKTDDLSWNAGVTAVTDGDETKEFRRAKILEVRETAPLPDIENDHQYTIPVVISYADGTTENAEVVVKVRPATPEVSPKEDATVDITPNLTAKGTATITYTAEDETAKTVTLTRAEDGTWSSSDPEVPVDATTGKVTLKAAQVKDRSVVTVQTTSGTTGLTSKSDVGVAGSLEVLKAQAKDAIEEAAKNEKAEIEADGSLTKEQKAEKVSRVDTVKEAEKVKVDAATDADGVKTAQDNGVFEVEKIHTPGTLDEAKRVAKASLDVAAENEKQAITDDSSLTATEKQAKKEEVDRVKEAEQAKVDAAKTIEVVDVVKRTGETAIAEVHTPGNLEAAKEKAKSQLEAIAAVEKSKIENDGTLTSAERETQLQKLKDEVTKQKGLIDAANTAETLATTKEAADAAVKGVHQPGNLEAAKTAAKAALEDAATAEKEAIKADNSLTETEKQTKAAEVDKVKAAEQAKVDAAKTIEVVEVAKETGKTAIAEVHTPGNLDTAKAKAKAALDEAAATEKAAI